MFDLNPESLNFCLLKFQTFLIIGNQRALTIITFKIIHMFWSIIHPQSSCYLNQESSVLCNS